MNHWILGFWPIPIMIAIGMQNIQKCWEMHHLLWNKAWFQYDLPKSLCSGVKYGLKMWSGDLSKLKMCSGDRRNVLRRLSPSLKLSQKSPDIRTTISQNMHQYKGGWEQGVINLWGRHTPEGPATLKIEQLRQAMKDPKHEDTWTTSNTIMCVQRRKTRRQPSVEEGNVKATNISISKRCS